MITLLIVDDHAVVRAGLSLLLNRENNIEVIDEAADGDEAILKAMKLCPHVVLMDVNMPNGKNGLTATAELKQMLPETAVLILTMHDEDDYLVRAVEAGALGYVPKSAPYEELLTAIHCVAAGKACFYPVSAKRLMNVNSDHLKQDEHAGSYETLSEREKEVLSWIAKGYSNKEIAVKLVLSVKTIETHKRNLMEKLGLKTRPELIQYALKKGVLYLE